MCTKKNAPVIIFTYNRQDHTQKTIEALENNERANCTDVYVFSDGAKSGNDKLSVSLCRNYLSGITPKFRTFTVIEREKNIGLAQNIISGVNKIIEEHGKVIVMEDDLVTSKYFLSYMNEALDFYEEKKEVWHISGWNIPVDLSSVTNEDIFLWRVMSCSGGWATWSDRWKHFKKEPEQLIKSFSKSDIKRFNLDGAYDMWEQVLGNISGKINTWAIFWYATIFMNNGLCVNPTQSYVQNIGHDGTGVHCGEGEYKDNEVLCQKENVMFESNLIENQVIYNEIKKWYKKQKKSLFARVVNKLARIVIGKNLIK